MDFVNLTPHPITVMRDGREDLIIEPSGVMARIEEQPGFSTTHLLPDNSSTQVTEVSYTRIKGVPKPEAFTFYIVSLPVALAIPGRKDLVFPYPLVRDESGRVIGCSGFGRVA